MAHKASRIITATEIAGAARDGDVANAGVHKRSSDHPTMLNPRMD
jgi:hypothetical protein